MNGLACLVFEVVKNEFRKEVQIRRSRHGDTGQARVRVDIVRGANCVLSDVAEAEGCKPASHVDVLKLDVAAGVRLVAPDYARWEDSISRPNVLESDVPDGHTGLGVALLDQWVEHAAWAATVGLLLLLRTNVDGPPNGS